MRQNHNMKSLNLLLLRYGLEVKPLYNGNYIVSNDYSFKKALILNLITAARLLGMGFFVNEKEEDDKFIYNLRGPLERLGTMEFKILERPGDKLEQLRSQKEEYAYRIIERFCNSYVPSKDNLIIGMEMPEGKEEPDPPYCLLPGNGQDYVGTTWEPSINIIESCRGKQCDLKKALHLFES